MQPLLRSVLLVLAVLAGIAFLSITRSNNRTTSPPSTKLRVSASFYPLGFFAREIAGDFAEVKILTPAGAEPHDFEPSTRDIAELQQNALLLVLGGGFEPWAENVANLLKDSQTKVVAVGEGLIKEDPHIWLDPVLAAAMTQTITQSLAAIDPAHTDKYAQRSLELTTRLENLHARYSQGLTNCQRRDIVTSHSAFAPLAKRYGLNQLGISGLSAEAEPSPKRLAEIADWAKKRGVTTIFFETLVSPRFAQTIAREIGAATVVLDPIEGVSDEDTAIGANYFTLMEANLKNLQTALACQTV